MEGVGKGRNGEIAGKMEKQPGCMYVYVREKNQAETWKSSQKDGKAARKMEKQLVVVVVVGNERAAGKAEKHTAGEGGWKSSWGGWVWKSRQEDGKVAGKAEKQERALKSTWEDGKAAGRMRKLPGGSEEQPVGGSRKASGKTGSRKGGKASGGGGRAPGKKEKAARRPWWGGKSRRKNVKGAGKAAKASGEAEDGRSGGHSPALACSR